MNPTSISYLTHTWNPLAMRCTKVSPACDHCWHLRMARRLAANPAIHPQAQAAYAGSAKPVLIADRLDEPGKRKKPAVIGVQFMGDLFHPCVPEDFVWAVIGTAYEAPQHTFLILTKRPARMLNVLTKSAWWNNDTPGNIWLGVTVENQATADERIPLLLQTPAARRFVSAEPLLEAVDLRDCLGVYQEAETVIDFDGHSFYKRPGRGLQHHDGAALNWVITGGETGPGARPSHPDWFRGLRDQCAAASVPFHFKQWGEWVDYDNAPGYSSGIGRDGYKEIRIGHRRVYRLGNKRAGDKLDGRKWQEMPEVTK